MPSSDTQFKKGHITSKEIKEKISIANKGKHNSPNTEFKKGHLAPKTAFKRGNIPWCVGKKLPPHTKEHKRKQSLALKGRPRPWFVGRKFTEEHKRKISEGLKGKLKGKHLSEEHKKKLSLAKIGHPKPKNAYSFPFGEKHPLWLGGRSFRPYTTEWTRKLKQSIRERDNYTCQLCGKIPSTNVHHKNYDKKNCNPENLITLCHNCHTKTNHNRKHWLKLFGIDF